MKRYTPDRLLRCAIMMAGAAFFLVICCMFAIRAFERPPRGSDANDRVLLVCIAAICASVTWELCRGALRSFNVKPPHGHCPQCGYDLRASKDRCPECGAPADGEPTKSL